MNKAKELKKLLGGRYCFQALMSGKQLARLLQNPPAHLAEPVAAILTAGCIKAEAVLFRTPDGLELGYDIFVKDSPHDQEWICFDGIPSQGSARETDMAEALDKYVADRGLSYTECSFTRLDGKTVKPKEIAL